MPLAITGITMTGRDRLRGAGIGLARLWFIWGMSVRGVGLIFPGWGGRGEGVVSVFGV